MIVTFENITSVKRMTELERAAFFFADILLSRKSVDELELEIVLVRDITEKGNIEVLDHEEMNPTMFRLELKKDKIDEQIATLAHEMVHLKQYHMGELRDTEEKDIYLWNNVLKDMTDIDYHDYPWEIEAYGREVGLNFKYRKKHPKLLLG